VQEESVDSINRALAFFAEHYPDEPVSALVCKSWMLDPQLRDYLKPGSNLLRFQERWQLVPHVPLGDRSEGDREMMRLGLQIRTPENGISARSTWRGFRKTPLFNVHSSITSVPAAIGTSAQGSDGY